MTADRVLSPVYFVPPTMCHHLVRVMRDMTDLSSKLYCVIVLFSLCKTETHPLVSNTCTTASTRTLTGNPSRESNNYWRLNLIVEIDTRKMQEVIWSKFIKYWKLYATPLNITYTEIAKYYLYRFTLFVSEDHASSKVLKLKTKFCS